MEVNHQTDREIVKELEDEKYTSVIIKRNDFANRHPNDTLELAIEEGLEQYDRTNFSLFMSSIAAGLILGFTAMLVAIAHTASFEVPILNRLIVACLYPLGFIICILSGTQLFTEHTATAFYPFLDKKFKLKSLLVLWGIIILGNIVGTFISSIMLYHADYIIHGKEGFLITYNHLLEFDFFQVFYSAILAGWLMAQGGWLVLSTTLNLIKVVCIFIVTFIIGFAGFHHSIAGSAEIFSGLLFSSDPEYLKSVVFIVAALAGNLVGGIIFVALLNYSHIKRT